jgi:hypothetical protein
MGVESCRFVWGSESAQDAWFVGVLSRSRGLRLGDNDGVEKPLDLFGDDALSEDYLETLAFCRDEVVGDACAQPNSERERIQMKGQREKLQDDGHGLSLQVASMICWRSLLDAKELEALTEASRS